MIERVLIHKNGEFATVNGWVEKLAGPPGIAGTECFLSPMNHCHKDDRFAVLKGFGHEGYFKAVPKCFAASDDGIYQIVMPSQLPDFADRQTSCANLRYNLDRGPRVTVDGQLAKDIRYLRQRHGAPRRASGVIETAASFRLHGSPCK
ncbi:MAG: hypothetical protein C0467_28790 [Planctomycetaceae bacterium]|nr:hypothetical protein [Planctomycetaceae bacterium]